MDKGTTYNALSPEGQALQRSDRQWTRVRLTTHSAPKGQALQRSACLAAGEQSVLPWLRDQQSPGYSQSPPSVGSPQPQQQPRPLAPLVLGGGLAGVDGLEGLGTDLGSFRAEDNIERFISDDIDQARERGGSQTRWPLSK